MVSMKKLWIVMPLLALIAAGCGGQNATEDTAGTMADSLLASSPIEQPEGDITPQTEFEQPAEPAPTPTPAPKRTTSTPKPTPTPAPRQPVDEGVTIAAGTPIDVAVALQISTETAKVGDTWTGEVKDNVIVGDKVVIPAGSIVTGIINETKPAQKGDRALLDLEVQSVNVNGKTLAVNAGTEAIEAGSTRARNLGAIAGAAAAGALVGKAVGGSGKGALIGGLIGGAAATGAVAKSQGYQVVLKEGTVLTFNVSTDTKVRS